MVAGAFLLLENREGRARVKDDAWRHGGWRGRRDPTRQREPEASRGRVRVVPQLTAERCDDGVAERQADANALVPARESEARLQLRAQRLRILRRDAVLSERRGGRLAVALKEVGVIGVQPLARVDHSERHDVVGPWGSVIDLKRDGSCRGRVCSVAQEVVQHAEQRDRVRSQLRAPRSKVKRESDTRAQVLERVEDGFLGKQEDIVLL
mmetsp:Transcript_1658/g.4224  ORF Transcript_1658/g.4224 Transcript_1658/m.4224 type:complete len:209 (-) Transcript_1658:1028-1654(-)